MTVHKILLILLTLLVGTVGGAVAALTGLPAPWLAGSLAAAILALAAGLPLSLPGSLRKAAFIFLGLQTGLSVTPETLERAKAWPLSLLGLAITVVVIIWLCLIYFRRCGWSTPSALFASLPGALSLVLLLAEKTTADLRRVVVAQCVRLVLLIMLLPILIRSISPTTIQLAGPVMSSPASVLLVVLIGGVMGWLLERLQVPAGLILGPCFTAAALSLSGTISGAAPDLLLIPANITLGLMIGMRLDGTSKNDLENAAHAGFMAFLLALAIAAAGAAAMSLLTGLPYALTLLAYAPGGLEAMTILAFALNLDPAYVAAHQVARYIGLVLAMPAATRFILSRAKAASK